MLTEQFPVTRSAVNFRLPHSPDPLSCHPLTNVKWLIEGVKHLGMRIAPFTTDGERLQAGLDAFGLPDHNEIQMQ